SGGRAAAGARPEAARRGTENRSTACRITAAQWRRPAIPARRGRGDRARRARAGSTACRASDQAGGPVAVHERGRRDRVTPAGRGADRGREAAGARVRTLGGGG